MIKKVLILILIMSTLLFSGCMSRDEVILYESYGTYDGILYNYTNITYTLYRFDSNKNITYVYSDIITYDIINTLEEGKHYFFDFYSKEVTGNVYSSRLISIRDSTNTTVWSG